MKISKNVRKQLFNILFVVILVGITFGVLIASNDELNYQEVKSFFSKSNLWLLGCAVVCMLLFLIFEAISMHVICRRLGYRPKFRASLAYSTSDNYYSALTPSASGGQPASAFYMVRDGIDGGTSGFALLFNLLAYTGAILVIGFLSFALGFRTFWGLGVVVRIFVILGFAMQILLFAFFFLCMKNHKLVLKFGNGIVRLLCKLHIMKKKEKWLDRWALAVEKYRCGFEEAKKHKSLFVWALLFNVLQRTSQILISYFVVASVYPNISIIEIFCVQSFITLGYNSIPLPGGVGVYEFLYLPTYMAIGLDKGFVLVAMMVTRIISYYGCMLLCGVYTLTYHMVAGKKHKQSEEKEKIEEPPDEATPKQVGDIMAVVEGAAKDEIVEQTQEVVLPDPQDEPLPDLPEN